jgi:RHS repeat-associated protein
LLRPTKVLGVNVNIPITETIYDDTNLTVTVRKQIDETNWDEATSYADSLGRTKRTRAKDSQGDVVVATEYDNLGRVAKTSNPYRVGADGVTPSEPVYWSKPRYDELNRVVETFAPALVGQTGASLGITEWGISTVTDFVGTFTIATDASGRKARSITNSLGQLIRIDEPQTVNGVAELGTLLAPLQPTFYKYNPQGKMVKVSQGVQNRYFLYDYLGRLIRVRQPEQEVNPALDKTDLVTNNSEWTAAMEYDLIGNLIKTTDAENKQITNTYDNAGRVKVRSYSNLDTPSVFYYYDGKGLAAVPDYSKGKLTKVSSSISVSQFISFDNFGRTLTSEQITDGQTYTSKYKYNFSGALVEQTYPSGKVVRNFFDNDRDLAKVVRNGKTYISDFVYDAAGGVKSLKLGNGRFETAEFNSRQQLTQLGLGTSASDTSLFKLDYEYGELTANGTIQNTGNITKQTITLPNASFVQTYKYDSLARLTEAKETTGTSATENWKQTFGYDRFGNRTGFSQQISGQNLAINSQTLPSIDTTSNRFDLNQGFIYDKTGNIIQDIDRLTGQQRRFVFNGENKQVEVRNPNLPSTADPIARYYYDGSGSRVKKETALEKTIFVYDGSGKLIAEYSTQLSQNPTTSYLTTDHLGTPRVITDKNGNVISRRDMMPFGEDLYAGIGGRTGDSGQKYSSSQDEIRQKFTGYLKDKETNLDFAEARYYNNLFGRFTAVDPMLASGKSSDPQTFNRYVYTLNNPVVFVDSSGLYPVYFNQKTNRFSHFHKKGYSRWEGGVKIFKQKFNGKTYTIRISNSEISYFSKNANTSEVRGDGSTVIVTPKPKPAVKSDAPLSADGQQLVNVLADKTQTHGKIALAAGLGGGAIGGGIGLCVVFCGPAAVIAGPSVVGAATNPVSGPAIGLGLGLGAGYAGAKLIPADGLINVGGLTESGGGTKVNTETPREPIDNLVTGNAENIGEIFEPSSANQIISNRFPTSGIQDWNKFGQGAYTVLQPGGNVDLFVTVSGDSYTSVVNGLNNAGFQNVTATPIGNPRDAWVYRITGVKPQ